MDGVTFLAGREGPCREQPETLLMRINPDGSHSEVVYHKAGYYSSATCIVETDEHNLFVAGNLFNEQDDEVMILLFDKDLNLLAERSYEKEVEAISFGTCRATSDSHGNLIVSTTVRQAVEYDTFLEHGVFFKFDRRGNLISHRYLIEEYPHPVFFLMNFWLKQMWYREDSETLLCLAWGNGNITSFITFDSAFNYLEEYPIWRDDPTKSDHTLYNDCYTDHWYSDDEALFFGGKGDDEHSRLRVSRINTQGEFLQYIHLNDRPDTLDSPCKSRCMATANDSTFYFSFYQHALSYHPGIATVYLLNDKLEIIGRYLDHSHACYRSQMIFPTEDGGCITVNDSCNTGNTLVFGHPVITKLNREDFETVPWSIQPSNNATLHPYPNPTTHYLTIPLGTLDLTNASCRISDQSGHTIVHRNIHGEGNLLQLDVSSLKKGLHLIQIFKNGQALFSDQFIKK